MFVHKHERSVNNLRISSHPYPIGQAEWHKAGHHFAVSLISCKIELYPCDYIYGKLRFKLVL